MKTKIKNIAKTATIAVSSAVLGFALFLGLGATYATWEAPDGEIEGGKFMNLLKSILAEEPVWSQDGTLISDKAVKKARTIVDVNDDNIIYAENGNVIIRLGSQAQTTPSSGSLTAKLNSNTPDSQIIVGGSSNVKIASFDFDANTENADIEDLTVEFTVPAEAPSNSTNAIDSITLYYNDGTPVLKNDGSVATVANVTDGLASLTGLNLIIDSASDTTIDVYATINDVTNSADTAKSNMQFATKLSFANGEYNITGVTSGVSYSSITTDGASNNTATGNTMYIFTNKVVATKSIGADTTLGAGWKDTLKVQFTKNTGEAYLKALSIDINKTTSIGSSFGVCELKLVNNNFDTIASIDAGTGAALTGTQNFTVGTCATGTCAQSDLVNLRDVISEDEVYTVEAKIEGINESGNCDGSAASFGDDDEITFRVAINGNEPNTSDDYITWQDYGTNGQDGVAIKWIDLGNSSTTEIVNSLEM